MVALDEDGVEAPAPAVTRRRGASAGPSRTHGRRPSLRSRPSFGSDVGPFLFLVASLAPLAGALFRIVDLAGLDGLTATTAVGPRLQLLGNAVNPLTGLLLVAGVVSAVIVKSAHVRMVAGIAVAVATLLLVVAVAVTVAAVRDQEIFSRVNDAHVEVISYEVGSALVAIGVIWLALQVLRRPGDA